MGYKPHFQDGVNAVATLNGYNWELEDQYGHVRSKPIIQEGLHTGYNMLYKEVYNQRGFSGPLWTPVGSVSEQWQPIKTSTVVENAIESLRQAGLIDENPAIKTKHPGKSHKSTLHRVDIPLNTPFELPTSTRDSGSRFAGSDSKEVYYPTVTLWNGYSGDCSLRAGLTIRRMVCSNGLVIPTLSGSFRNLHTPGSVYGFLNKVTKMDFLSKCNEMRSFLIRFSEMKLDDEKEVTKDFTKMDTKRWASYPDHTAMGLINFLSYRQTHDASVSVEARYQKMINRVFKLAA